MNASSPIETPRRPLEPPHDITPDGSDVGDVLVALADPTRRRLLETLADAGEGTATALAAPLPISRQAVVKHLSVLESAGLVAGRRAGREVRYRVEPEPLAIAARWLANLAAASARRLASVERFAEPGRSEGAGERGDAPSWRVW